MRFIDQMGKWDKQLDLQIARNSYYVVVTRNYNRGSLLEQHSYVLIKRIEIEIKALDYRGIDVQLLGFILNSAANRTFEMVVGGGGC